jgi:hypothetical protein
MPSFVRAASATLAKTPAHESALVQVAIGVAAGRIRKTSENRRESLKILGVGSASLLSFPPLWLGWGNSRGKKSRESDFFLFRTISCATPAEHYRGHVSGNEIRSI